MPNRVSGNASHRSWGVLQDALREAILLQLAEQVRLLLTDVCAHLLYLLGLQLPVPLGNLLHFLSRVAPQRSLVTQPLLHRLQSLRDDLIASQKVMAVLVGPLNRCVNGRI